MSVRIQLDQHDAPHYTNLDFVTGRVILSLATDTTISTVTVKLEGECKTRLSGPKFANDPRNRQKVNLEIHKLLYKVQTVFPAQSIVDNAANIQVTLGAGQYSYPFSFKIPFNNDCISNTTIFSDLKLGNLLGPDITNARHVKQTLPPTLTSFPGEAGIRYFVKATVARPKFYQENIRCETNIKFQPVEPPRPAIRNEETYARRQHQFYPPLTTSKSSKGGVFKKAFAAPPDEIPCTIKVEARLPSPTIITCQQSLPVRVLVEKTNDSPASIYLSLLQIELIGSTHVRAYDFNRTETGSWILTSLANMKLPLDNPIDRAARSFQIPSRFWDNIPLPDTVVPSFTTCNITRSYELEVRVGINHGMASGIHPELAVLPLRLPVQVFSGITPPERILNRINTAQSTTGATLTPTRPGNNLPQYQNSPITPMQDHRPAPTGTSYTAPPPEYPNDLPPSYEDAMADDITPVDGPRRNDTTVSVPSSAPPPWSSSASGGGLNRHPSERLFSQNAPSPPNITSSSTAPQSGTRTNEATDSLTRLDVNDQNSSNVDTSDSTSRPPPLPARKATVDGTLGQKKTA